MAKELLYLSLLHTSIDLGSASGRIARLGERAYGKVKWLEHQKAVEDAWSRVEKCVLGVDGGSYNNLRIYQDGLPIGGDVGKKIVTDLSKKGSRNHVILEYLVKKGAILEAAEDANLLIEEYNLAKKGMRFVTEVELLKYKEKQSDLLDRRDSYIAKYINATLQKGELGIAFFGAAHRIVDKLIGDILVTAVEEFKDPISLQIIRASKK